MCRILLIKNLQEWKIDSQLLEDLDLSQGGDGIGMGYFEDNEPRKVVIPISSTRHMINAATKTLNQLKERGIIQVLYHTRLVSRGAKILENLHPFLMKIGEPINKKAWFCHNGTISNLGKVKDNKGDWSDTRTFAKLLNGLPWETIQLNFNDNQYEVFVLLTEDGKFYKFQEKTYETKKIVDTETPIEHSPVRTFSGYSSIDYYDDAYDYYQDHVLDLYGHGAAGRNNFGNRMGSSSSSRNINKKFPALPPANSTKNSSTKTTTSKNMHGVDDWHDRIF